MSSDVDKSQAFYGGLFGWTFEGSGPEFGGYISASADGRAVAGLMARSPEMTSPDAWSTYISTDDLAATIATATAAGGQVMLEPMDVGDLGRMAYLVDPAGGVVGLWQPGTFTGFGRYNEPDTVTWDEHHSKDFRATTAFYAAVFGWTYDTSAGDTDDFRYYQAQVDGNTVAGLMDSATMLPAEVPTHWTVYFSVADADAAVAKVIELGGAVIRPAEDTPYGRMAAVADPTGATFSLIQVPAAS
jgi:predicted enzyme related to lactoylglutathione lyase